MSQSQKEPASFTDVNDVLIPTGADYPCIGYGRYTNTVWACRSATDREVIGVYDPETREISWAIAEPNPIQENRK